MKLGGFPERIWRSRLQRIGFALVAGAALATNVPPGPLPPPPGPGVAGLTFAPIPLNEQEPEQRRAGALLFLAGWEIAGDDRRFGGISAMQVVDGQVTAISDAGTLLRFALPGRGPARVRLDPLPQGPGPATRKSNRDTEAMAIEGGEIRVAFEKHNMIWRYRLPDLTPVSAARPAAMRGWRVNAGAEAMVRLADGRYLVFSEGRSDDRALSDVVLFDGDPSVAGTRAARLDYRRPPGFRITDAALLPDGRLLLLNRRFALFDGISATLAIADPRDIRPGAILAARQIAALQAPLTVDNMEALSVTRENGRTIVWIASDDNFFPLQRTLLMKFALVE
jgi:hypothetical protein